MYSTEKKTFKRPAVSDDEEAGEDTIFSTLKQDSDSEADAATDGFADAMFKVLAQPVTGDKAPILAKRTTELMRSIAKAKSDLKLEKLQAQERKAKRVKDVVIPDHTGVEKDRKLRKIATKGVVALFNAISKHQLSASELQNEKSKDKEKIKELSKENFLHLLKSKEVVPKQHNQSFLNENYLMGAKMKDWAKEDDELPESTSPVDDSTEGSDSDF